MELAVLIAAAVGILLFAISYLKFAYEGFRYHLITGVLALIPVINLVALPTLWDRTNRMLMVGLVGLVIAIGAWFLGAGKTFHAYWGNRQAQQVAAPVVTNTGTPIATAPVAGSSAVPAVTTSVADRKVSLLPSKALYRLDFESASADQIKTFTGRIVKITSADHTVTDGRIQSVTPSSVFIEQSGDGQIAYEMMLSNIKSIEVMVKRAAR
ncbi:hypothetical protein [Leucothrix pacifica]|uniref:Uncharacterized protein n=1 Tax=Leucothrix pacifica TaxID=1247513 RepID=A0A317CNJ8_9GAMM|nr:hypothetical protein [Leucothrix pacifica]PWQ99053.1 hypothetical protein DKW60_06295 [Leucothrix pacifica]